MQLKERVIGRSKEEDGQVVSPIIVAENASGEKRAVVNFKELNTYIWYDAIAMMMEGDDLLKIDL